MKVCGMPETFWVVTRPSEVSELVDILFPCTFERLLLQGRGGLTEDEIVGIYADETEAKEAATELLGKHGAGEQRRPPGRKGGGRGSDA
jgi:hypothetical protein